MATIGDLHRAERSMRELLDGADLPQPDDVEYGEESVVLFWHEAKLVVQIDVTDECLEKLRDGEPRQPASPRRAPADNAPGHA
jgi:hypothetical protein